MLSEIAKIIAPPLLLASLQTLISVFIGMMVIFIFSGWKYHEFLVIGSDALATIIAGAIFGIYAGKKYAGKFSKGEVRLFAFLGAVLLVHMAHQSGGQRSAFHGIDFDMLIFIQWGVDYLLLACSTYWAMRITRRPVRIIIK